MRRGLLLVLLAAALTGCGSNGDGDLTVRDELAGAHVRLDLPKDGDAQAVALWFHGQADDEDARMNEPWLNSLREDGWAVASSDFHGSQWGSPLAVKDALALQQWAADEAGAPVTLWVAGSMGGTTSLNALLEADDLPSCWYGTMPVIDLDAAAVSVPGAADEIKAARADDNPAEHIDDLPRSVTYRVRTSDDDTLVDADANGALLEAVGASSSRATGQHGDDSHFDAEDLATFAEGCHSATTP